MSDSARNMVTDRMTEVARMAIEYGVSAKDVRRILVECWHYELAEKQTRDAMTLTEAL